MKFWPFRGKSASEKGNQITKPKSRPGQTRSDGSGERQFDRRDIGSMQEFRGFVFSCANRNGWIGAPNTTEPFLPNYLPGFPHLVLVRDRILYRYIKSWNNPMGSRQLECMKILRSAGGDCGVWRPHQIREIELELALRNRPEGDLDSNPHAQSLQSNELAYMPAEDRNNLHRLMGSKEIERPIRLQLGPEMFTSEFEFQDYISKFAAWRGWQVGFFEPWQVGAPDLILVRDRIIFRELKNWKGRLSLAQKDCLALLKAAGGDIDVWYPQQLNDIEKDIW